MKKIVQTVIESEGLKVIADPARFRQILIGNGYNVNDAIAMELMLNACPSIAMMLNQKEVSRAEANIMVATAVKNSNLTSESVRRLLGELLNAAGNNLEWQANYLLRIPKQKGGAVEIENEAEVLDRAVAVLNKNMKPGRSNESDGENTELEVAISALEKLSENGNGYASYYLGQYYKFMSDTQKTKGTTEGSDAEGEALVQKQFANRAVSFYHRSASQGYGPAYGALAAYEMSPDGDKNMARAAAYFENPTALAGRNGRQWSKNAARLLSYREENAQKGNFTITMLIIALVLSVAVAVVATTGGTIGAIVTAVFAAIGLVVCFLLKKFMPYFSYRGIYIAMMACWLLTTVLFAF